TVPRMEDRPRWDVLDKELTTAQKQAEARKQAARVDFGKWLTEAKVEQVQATIPTDALHFHAALSEGTGDQVQLAVNGQSRTVALATGASWDDGYIAAKALKRRPS